MKLIENKKSGARSTVSDEQWDAIKANGFSSRYKIVQEYKSAEPFVPKEVTLPVEIQQARTRKKKVQSTK